MATASIATSLPVLPRLLMVDDHQLVLDALGNYMKTDFNVRAVDSVPALIDSLQTFTPDVVMLDVNLSGTDGFTAARKVREAKPNVPVVFLSMYSEPSYVNRAAQVGAKAYLSKSAPAADVLKALRAVMNGQTLLPSEAGDEASSTPELTSRQTEVLRLIAQGASAKDIANQLNISVRTAEFHRAAIMQRLGLHSTAQMTRYALAHNLG